MKYKALWVVAVLAIFADFGMTLVLIQSPQFAEGNPNAIALMDEYGDVGGLAITVVLRLALIAVAMLIQPYSPVEAVVPAIILPACLYPVVWNSYLFILVALL